MAAVLRVKRALNDEPINALLLTCKRRKTDVSGNDPIETVFEFAGTVKHQEENITLPAPEKICKSDVKSRSKPTPNLPKKVRNFAKACSQSNRYKLVNYFRALGKPEKECGEDSKPITVLDVEAQLGEELESEGPKVEVKQIPESSSSVDFVYDLYYIHSDGSSIDVDDLLLDGMVSFAPLESELVFDSYRNHRAANGKDSDSDSPIMDDDDDSNDENNWRNDYPDEEESDKESSLIHGFGRVTFGDEELSSDSDDERLLYTEDLSLSDVNMYGPAYASFKKKVLKEMNAEDECFSQSDDESD